MPLLLMNLLGGLVLFALAAKLARRTASRARTAILFLSILVCAPALSYTLYYLHLFDDWALFYQARSYPVSNGYPALLGWLAGWGYGTARRASLFFIAGMVAFVCFPLLKPVLMPPDRSGYEDRWKDGVCVQTTPSSCGPASVATLLARQFNDRPDERRIAAATRTSATGTEVWYLAQYLRMRGYQIRFHTRRAVPIAPSIAGTRLVGAGHFVAITHEGGEMLVADPLSGALTTDLGQFKFTGFFMEVRKADSPQVVVQASRPQRN